MGNCEGKDYGLKNSPIYQNEIGKLAGHDHVDPDGMETVEDFECSENCPVTKLDLQAGERPSSARPKSVGKFYGCTNTVYSEFSGTPHNSLHDDKGGVSRYFKQCDWSHEVAERIANADPVRYQAKAAKRERNQNLDNFYWRIDKTAPIGFVRIDKDEWEALGQEEERIHKETGKHARLRAQGNIHSTLKPISLDVWLCRLLSPPEEYAPRRLLIPFLGTGSEMAAAVISGCWEEVVGVEINQDYCDIAEARVKFWHAKHQETGSSDPKVILKAKRQVLSKQKDDTKQEKLF